MSAMIVSVDGGAPSEALNSVKVVVGDRHITVSHEGVVVDLVRDGEVVGTESYEHEDLLAWEEEG